MTNEQNARIASALCGYEVQVSPAGKWYVVTGDETKSMPDYDVDSAETLSTVEALCKSRGWRVEVFSLGNRYHAWIESVNKYGPTITAALAHCLLQIAEGE